MKQQMVAPSSLVSDASADVQPSGFFSCLNANDRRQLMMLGASASWGGNEILFAQGAPVTQCFAVIDGVVALSRGIGDGRRQIIGFALAGDILEIAADGRHELSAVTIGPALMWEIPQESFRKFISPRPYAQQAVIASVAADLLGAHEHLFSLGRCPAEEKLAAFLIAWRDRLARLGKDIDPLPLPMSRKDIADHLGLTMETVCRTLAKLERCGVIEILPGKVRLLAEPGAIARAGC